MRVLRHPGAQAVSELDRAQMLLRLAAEFIREHAPVEMVRYDNADCDGYCLADDCEAAADALDEDMP
jgi:hypothetical protein